MKTHKKNIFIVILTICMTLVFCIYAYADNEMKNERELSSASLYKGPQEVRAMGNPKGRLISSVDVGMTDKGGGTVGVNAELLCHEPMKRLRIWLYLEKWNSEDEDWESLQYEQFSWVATDYPDEDLTMAIVSYDIPNLERGQDYRMRAIFGADALTSSLQEAWTVNTPGLFVE